MAFGEAVRLQPGLALAHYGLGQALMGQARYAEAADAFLSCRNVFALARRMDASKAREMEIRDLRDTLQALAGRHALSADRFLEMQLEKRLAELQKGALPSVRWVPPGVTLALGTAYFQAGALAEAMIQECPGGRLLATSREALRVPGEVVLIATGLLVLSGLDKYLEALLVEASPDWLTQLTTRY
jgi:tetratricopeptide (TPR) repeat protein